MADMGHVVGTTASEKALWLDNPNIKNGDDLLNKVAVGAYCSQQDVIFVEDSDNVLAVIKTLADNHIQSVPVRDSKKLKYNSFIDTLDILVHIMNVANKKLEGDAAQEAFASVDAKGLANLSNKDPFSPVGVDTPTKIALDKFVKWKAHRLPVLGGDGQLEMVLSQMGALEFLQKHASLFPVASKTVGELKLGYKPVCSVTEKDTVHRAFSLIIELGISGLAIVNENGHPSGGISPSDAKKLLSGGKVNFSILEKTVGEFKAGVVASDAGVVPGAVHIRPDATIEEVLLKFIVAKVHRLFVVENDKIVGIVSVIDALQVLNPQ